MSTWFPPRGSREAIPATFEADMDIVAVGTSIAVTPMECTSLTIRSQQTFFDATPFVELYRNSNTSWGLRFLQAGWYDVQWIVPDLAATTLVGPATGLDFTMIWDGIQDARASIFPTNFNATDDEVSLIIQTSGKFYPPEELRLATLFDTGSDVIEASQATIRVVKYGDAT